MTIPLVHPRRICRAGWIFGNARLALVPNLSEREITRFTSPLCFAGPQLKLMLLSTARRGRGLAGRLADLFQGRRANPAERPAGKIPACLFRLLQNKFFIDELYAATVIRLNTRVFELRRLAGSRRFGAARSTPYPGIDRPVRALQSPMDESAVNKSFDLGCEGLRDTGGWLSCLQNGRVQRYLQSNGPGFQHPAARLDMGGRMKTFPLLTLLTLIPLIGGVTTLLRLIRQKNQQRSPSPPASSPWPAPRWCGPHLTHAWPVGNSSSASPGCRRWESITIWASMDWGF
jgi:hypothetical protein